MSKRLGVNGAMRAFELTNAFWGKSRLSAPCFVIKSTGDCLADFLMVLPCFSCNFPAQHLPCC